MRTSSGCSRIASEIEQKMTPALASSSWKVVPTQTQSKTASTATRRASPGLAGALDAGEDLLLLQRDAELLVGVEELGVDLVQRLGLDAPCSWAGRSSTGPGSRSSGRSSIAQVGLLHLLPAVEGLEAPVGHPLGLAVLVRDQADDVGGSRPWARTRSRCRSRSRTCRLPSHRAATVASSTPSRSERLSRESSVSITELGAAVSAAMCPSSQAASGARLLLAPGRVPGVREAEHLVLGRRRAERDADRAGRRDASSYPIAPQRPAGPDLAAASRPTRTRRRTRRGPSPSPGSRPSSPASEQDGVGQARALAARLNMVSEPAASRAGSRMFLISATRSQTPVGEVPQRRLRRRRPCRRCAATFSVPGAAAHLLPAALGAAARCRCRAGRSGRPRPWARRTCGRTGWPVGARPVVGVGQPPERPG